MENKHNPKNESCPKTTCIQYHASLRNTMLGFDGTHMCDCTCPEQKEEWVAKKEEWIIINKC